ncbi:hypothetical protein pdul_cds_340 [Pandoravirus dulcis]|uniref:Uncharacterized protein n=1 Tax=Pandoravirus dulcis TaxID=1349409 RepID=A0A291ATY7_9VIRU|nr:hypothetical protein pdul_cds_340 [Pandoravirus dulcis]ATE82491.1 hypothetical protein pdul_cds_340 [Pandoravirus dulcis]
MMDEGGAQHGTTVAVDAGASNMVDQGDVTPADSTNATTGVVVVKGARYCRATGCVLVPVTIDGVVVHANWTMSSPHNIISPAASKRVVGAVGACVSTTRQPRAAGDGGGGEGDRGNDDDNDDRGGGNGTRADVSTGASGDDTRAPTTGPSNARRAWPTVCHAVGTAYRPRALSVGGADVRPRLGAPDVGIEFLCADSVRLSALSGVQLAHRAAQAHTSIVSAARPVGGGGEEGGGACNLLARLVDGRVAARPSVMWDMRAAPHAVGVAVGLAAPVSDPNAALVRLYAPDHPEVVAAGDERIAGLARAGALVRLLGIEVAVTPTSPTLRLALGGPGWAVVDAGVRACYFDQETRAAVVGALARAGPAPWRSCPLWARGTVLASEAAGVLDVPANEAPVLALVLAGHDPMRPVRLRLGRGAYVHTSPPHEVRFRWTNPEDRVNDGHGDDLAFGVQYAQVDLAAWMGHSPDGTCLIGNCAFDGRAALVDYEANVLAVFAAGADGR